MSVAPSAPCVTAFRETLDHSVPPFPAAAKRTVRCSLCSPESTTCNPDPERDNPVPHDTSESVSGTLGSACPVLSVSWFFSVSPFFRAGWRKNIHLRFVEKRPARKEQDETHRKRTAIRHPSNCFSMSYPAGRGVFNSLVYPTAGPAKASMRGLAPYLAWHNEFNRLLKKSHVARYGVEIRLKMLMYCPIHCAFSPDFALSRAHLRLFQQPVRNRP